MPFRWDYRQHVSLAWFVLKWLVICLPVGIVVGSAVALFLWSLNVVTLTQWDNPWLLYLLPLAGIASGLMYHYLGREAEGGNNLIMEQIHEPGGGVPLRMAPLVLIGTLITHLFGGSAGREGTAVQMGGSLAGGIGRLLKLTPDEMRILLSAGVAAGFGAVFGTPLTGAIFAVEVIAIGRMSYKAIIPCLMASVIGDQVNTAWGIGHTHYHIAFSTEITSSLSAVSLDWGLTGKVAIAAIFFGLASVLFAELTHGISWTAKRFIPVPWMRPAIGGCVVIALVWLVGTRDYLGLGVSSHPPDANRICIESCFHVGGAHWLSWWWKLLFTAVTVGSGFKGGEVTPLFFVGAALGSVLGVALGAPVDLMAGLGFVAVFAGATNTPLACTIMAIELFGPGHGELLSSGFVVYAAVACFLSYFLSGNSSIYHAQKRDEEEPQREVEQLPETD
ncbi:voltage-gated chloride channel family protein [Blastopirellula sp. JC732]|uniref:Voltage-gated chloride channel family protein n=1 Tax=Blastopirellula sediminis TaxID=2894196 RepID=A0A9X1SH29_9BACT|nr:voltage-gated chloride channel family protein [Blastopirellula sediminis]MCC9607356.1 voltage-gated chloride channel family protein [Blastopirellula sediminis]MCC9629351.1 voltage-gated chloride channel family protein [Blastopirellula sediminis]